MTDCKIVLIGDTGVGKSTVMNYLLTGKYEAHNLPTIGASFCIKKLKIGGKLIKLNIWDTAGQERFKSIASMYYKNTLGCACVFDVTVYDSFLNIDYWLTEYKKHCGTDDVNIVIVANKCDYAESEWQISKDEINIYSMSLNLPVFFTDCIEGTNIAEIFDLLATNIIEKQATDNFEKIEKKTDVIIRIGYLDFIPYYGVDKPTEPETKNIDNTCSC